MEAGVKNAVRFKREKDKLTDKVLLAKRDIDAGSDGKPTVATFLSIADLPLQTQSVTARVRVHTSLTPATTSRTL